MKPFLLVLALLAGQAPVRLQSKPVVRLEPHKAAIEPGFGGSLLELIDSPAVVHLPKTPPKADAKGAQWNVDVRNFGPKAVTIADKGAFQVSVAVGETVHIYSNGSVYLLRH